MKINMKFFVALSFLSLCSGSVFAMGQRLPTQIPAGVEGTYKLLKGKNPSLCGRTASIQQSANGLTIRRGSFSPEYAHLNEGYQSSCSRDNWGQTRCRYLTNATYVAQGNFVLESWEKITIEYHASYNLIERFQVTGNGVLYFWESPLTFADKQSAEDLPAPTCTYKKVN